MNTTMNTTTPQNELDTALAAIDNAAKMQRDAETAMAKIGQGRIDLVMGRDAKAVFFATIAMRLKMEADPAIGTAATDGKRIKYNPSFIAGLSRHEVVGLLAHEVLHVTNLHHVRMGDRDPQTWNVAADLAINPMLTGSGFVLPTGGIAPGEGNYADLAPGLAAEEYYKALQDRKPQKQDGNRDGGEGEGKGEESTDPGQCGGVEKPGKGSPAECQQAEAEAKQMTAGAEQAVRSSGRGALPGGIGRSVAEVLEPKADWKAVLREFVARTARNDYSWSRPNRRFVHRGLYLPGLHSEDLGKVAIAIDVSGSVGPEQLAAFAGEVQGILDAYDCELTILYHDHAVQRVQEWRSSDGPLKLETCGGGGTSHVPVFAKVEADQIDPACMIALTDMYSEFPAVAPDFPVLWVNVGGRATEGPFGRMVTMN